MFSYTISPYKTVPSAAPKDYLKKDNILLRQIRRCPHKVGEYVSWKSKKVKHWGRVAELCSDVDKVEWKGNQPHFIIVHETVYNELDGELIPIGHKTVNLPLSNTR